jgi:prevent-host-death family protein
MLHVELENIVSETEAISRIGELMGRVDGTDQIVVITKNNQPSVALVSVAQLEGLTGRQVRPAAPMSATPPMVTPLAPSVLPDLMDEPVADPVAVAPMAPMAPAPEVTPLPSLPDFPGDEGFDQEVSTPTLGFTPQAAPVLPAAPALPTVPAMPTPPEVPTMPAAPAVAAPYSVPPVDMPAFALRNSDGGLPPEDLNSSSPLG